MASKKGRAGSNAWFISDRSGFRYPYSESISEPGTGWRIHYSESDGEYNLVDHPLNHVQRYVKFGDPSPVVDPRGRELAATVTPPANIKDGNANVIDGTDNIVDG